MADNILVEALNSVPQLQEGFTDLSSFKTKLTIALNKSSPTASKAIVNGQCSASEERIIRNSLIEKAPDSMQESLLTGCPTAVSVFVRLQERVQATVNATKSQLHASIDIMKWEKGDTGEKLFRRAMATKAQLHSAGEEVSNFKVVDSCLKALPSRYKDVKRQIRHGGSTDFDTIIKTLTIEEQYFTADDISEDSTAHQVPDAMAMFTRSATHAERKYCTYCKRTGHLQPSCWDRIDDEAGVPRRTLVKRIQKKQQKKQQQTQQQKHQRERSLSVSPRAYTAFVM